VHVSVFYVYCFIVMNSFGTLFHDKIFFPDISLTVNNIPDISPTCFKFPDISSFSRQVVTLNLCYSIKSTTVVQVAELQVFFAAKIAPILCNYLELCENILSFMCSI